jgi:type I restriction enzyme, S subunit
VTETTIPHTWSMASLCDLGEWRGGGTPSKFVEDYWNGNIPWVSPKDMKQNSICDSADHITENAINDSATKLIPPDSILCVTRSGILAHTFPVAITVVPVTVNQDIKALTPFEGIDARYLTWVLRAHGRAILQVCSKYGTTVNSIETSRLYAYRVPVAPQKEQRRIVSKIEALFSQLDNGIESLELARSQLEIYRHALLRAAFEGKLTAHWRQQNKSTLESPEHLISRIKNERNADYQARISVWNAESDENGGRPRPPKVFTPLSKQDLDELPILPHGWIWEKLGWMTCGVEYGTAAKSSERGKVPVLRMGNIQNAKFDWSDLVYTSDQDEIRKYSLREGDVLFNRTNSPELVGKTAIYRGERAALFAGYLIRIDQLPSIVDSQYLNLFLNSHIARQQGNRVKTDGVNQSNINGEKLSNYPFPYCSLAEQREIVKLLEEKLSVVDQMLEDAHLQIQKADGLRQSILKRAFSGKLVAQNPKDEPASHMLERIRSRNAEKDNGKKKMKRKDAA